MKNIYVLVMDGVYRICIWLSGISLLFIWWGSTRVFDLIFPNGWAFYRMPQPVGRSRFLRSV